MGKLNQKVFLVFGGASGMAKATTELFAAEGAKVVVADISKDAVKAEADTIKEAGGDAACVVCNAMLEADIAAAVDFAVETYGRLDIVQYQPGDNKVSELLNLSTEDWNEAITLNLTGPFLAIKYAGKKMKESGGGVIILTSSLNSTVPYKTYGSYCTTKAGLDMLARVAAIELGPEVRVNTINPGFINTPAIGPFTANQEIMDKVMESHCTGRIGEPEDYAKLALFLCSDDGSYFTGGNIVMDGGGRNFGYPDIIPLYFKSLGL